MMNVRNRALLICWLAMVTILSLDLVTTIIGVEMLGATEINQLVFRFLGLGLVGYLLVLIVYATFFYLALEFLGLLYRVSYRRVTGSKLNIEFEIAAYCFIASVFVLLDFITIVRNIWIIFELI